MICQHYLIRVRFTASVLVKNCLGFDMMSKDFIDRLAKVLFLANLTNEEKSSLDKTPSNITKDSSLEDIAALLMKIIPSYVDPVNVKEDSPEQV